MKPVITNHKDKAMNQDTFNALLKLAKSDKRCVFCRDKIDHDEVEHTLAIEAYDRNTSEREDSCQWDGDADIVVSQLIRRSME